MRAHLVRRGEARELSSRYSRLEIDDSEAIVRSRLVQFARKISQSVGAIRAIDRANARVDCPKKETREWKVSSDEWRIRR